ncbi:hypothetical protein [Thermococcus paralvinellae]|uniref:hypothetical protein n=1 Tax=Thermococcus paralvinellae TaxID=582419 RepID=UPI000A4C9126|nr:hypothetical protein [Thermococcus paralvinellae]
MRAEIWNVGKGIKVANVDAKYLEKFLLEDGVYKITYEDGKEEWRVVVKEGNVYL